MPARTGFLDEIGRGVGSNGGNGTDAFSAMGVGNITSSSKGSSLGVGGNELSSVDVESRESWGPRDMDGAVVGLGCNFSPREPMCCGRPEVGVVGAVVWLPRRGRPSMVGRTAENDWLVLLAERDMTGEVVLLDARRGIPGMGPEIPEPDSISSTCVGGVQKPFFECGTGLVDEAVSLTGDVFGGVGVEYGILCPS